MKGTLALSAVLGALTLAGTVEGQDKEKQAASGQATAQEYEGWRQYMVTCARCHGDDAVGGIMAPDVRTAVSKGMSEATFNDIVINGRPDKGMPAHKGTLSPEQSGAIFAYVEARAARRLAAGRPERSS